MPYNYYSYILSGIKAEADCSCSPLLYQLCHRLGLHMSTRLGKIVLKYLVLNVLHFETIFRL